MASLIDLAIDGSGRQKACINIGALLSQEGIEDVPMKNKNSKKPDRQTARTRANRVNVPRPKKNEPHRPNEEILATSTKTPIQKNNVK